MEHAETQGIYRRGEIYWLQLPMEHGVRPKPITLQTKDLKEAITLASQIRKAPFLRPATELLTEVEHFLNYKTGRRNFSASTRKAKFYVLRSFVQSLPRRASLESVTTERLQQYYDGILHQFSVGTAHKALMDIRSFFRWALEVEKKVRRNPAVGVRHEDVVNKPCMEFCTKAQRDKLIRECPREDLKLVLILGFHAGMRKREIIEAVPCWFAVEKRQIHMASTTTMVFNRYKRARSLPMREEIHDFLLHYGLRDPFLLRPEVKQGKDVYRYDFDVGLQNYVKTQGMEWVTAKVMRHTFASLLVQDGCSLFKVAKWMGDTVRVVEKHYAHLAPNDDDIEEKKAQKPRRPVASRGIPLR